MATISLSGILLLASGNLELANAYYYSSVFFMDFPGSSDGKASAYNAGDLGSVPGLGRSPGEGKYYPLQYSGLENSMKCIVHGVAKSQTLLSEFHNVISCEGSWPPYSIEIDQRADKV